MTGVFAALTAYFSQVPEHRGYLAPVQISCTLAMFLLLLIEVFASIPKNVTYRLMAFDLALFLFFLLVERYFVQTYRQALMRYSFVWLWFVYMRALAWLFEREDIVEWVRPHAKRIEDVLPVLLGMGLLALAAPLAWVTSQLIVMIVPR